MHLSVVLLMFSLVSVCSWAHRSYTDTRPYKRASDDTCVPIPCTAKAGADETGSTNVCPSTTCTYNRTQANLIITVSSPYHAKSSQIDVNAFGTSMDGLYITQADFSNITFTLDATHGKKSKLKMPSINNCSVSGVWQNSSNADIKCSLSDLILEGKDNPGSVSLDVKESEATVTVTNSSGKIWIQNSNLTLDIISSNNISLSITNCTIPERVSLSHLDHSITIHDQKECDQHLVHPHTITTTTSTTTTTTTTPPTTKTLYYYKDGIVHIYYYYCDWAPLWVRAGLAIKGVLMVGALLGIIAFFKYNMPAWRKEYAWMRQTEEELGLR